MSYKSSRSIVQWYDRRRCDQLLGLYPAVTAAQWYTLFFSIFMAIAAGIGVTAGAHRLWCHKAKLPLQILLMVLHSMAFQNSVQTWVKDHRSHHRFCDTDADPHNSSRGFFYLHIGWLMVKTHPEVKKRRRLIDLSDVTSNRILTLQYR